MYKINKDTCLSCGLCVDACPIGCVYETKNGYEIDGGQCVQCGTCTNMCPACCIEDE